MNNRPSVFIGSSTEGLDFARPIRGLLTADAELTLWSEGFFTLGKTFIETLVNSLSRFDFAILVLTPDDLITSRADEKLGPRDNVIFELGLFMGRLGRERTFVVHQTNSSVKLPSDLMGVTAAGYDWPRMDRDQQNAVGPACDSIRRAIRDLGFAEGRTSQRLQVVAREQERQKEQIEVLSFLLAHFVPHFELEHLKCFGGDTEFHYDMHPGFEREIRHLWELNFITKTHDFKIASLPHSGDLKHFFKISPQGRNYLKLRGEYPV